MRKSKFTDAQIVAALKELDSGTPATTLARKLGVHVNTLRAWKDKYAGLEASDLVRLKQLEAENAQMRRIIARKELELDAVRELIENNGWGLSARKDGVRALRELGCSQRSACSIIGISERAMQYRPRRVNDPKLAERMKSLAGERLDGVGGVY